MKIEELKKYNLYIAIIVLVVFNIKCSGDKDPLPEVADLVSFKVNEYKTNLPLQGVTVTTYFCRKYDFEFGACTEVVMFASCITDNNGICKSRFPEDNFHRITIEKSGYWTKYVREISNEFIIQPEAWVDINFITNEEYPETSYFFIAVIGENGDYMNNIPAATTANQILTLYGNEVNKIEWVLYETYNSTSEILNSGNFELNPEKFENLNYTLNY